MNILVVGGAGYIGSHTAKQLLDSGHHVTVCDNLTTGFEAAVPEGAYFINLDVNDTEALTTLMKAKRFDGVVHFAAKLSVLESMCIPTVYFKNNTMGVLSLIQACAASNVKKIVFSSTAATYGNVLDGKPLIEDMQTQPINPYGWSKLMSEQILKDCGKEHGIDVAILRYFNIAGAALDNNNGQRTKNAYHLIHVGSQAAAGKRSKVAIYGTDYPTPDGTCIRDYIHVEDLAQLHILAMDYLANGGATDTFNCGYGHGFSVREVLEALRKVSGHQFPIVEEGRRAGDPAVLIADSSKIRKAFNWQPKYDDLELICRTAFEWEKKI